MPSFGSAPRTEEEIMLFKQQSLHQQTENKSQNLKLEIFISNEVLTVILDGNEPDVINIPLNIFFNIQYIETGRKIKLMFINEAITFTSFKTHGSLIVKKISEVLIQHKNKTNRAI